MKVFTVKIEIRPKPGVLDPQGKAVASALKRLGHNSVSSVVTGKLVELTVEASDKKDAESSARKMCADLLVNPAIEVSSLEVQESGV